MDELWHIWRRHDSYERVLSHIELLVLVESCWWIPVSLASVSFTTYERVMTQICFSVGTHGGVSAHTDAHTCMSVSTYAWGRTHINEACRTYSFLWQCWAKFDLSHLPHMNESWHMNTSYDACSWLWDRESTLSSTLSDLFQCAVVCCSVLRCVAVCCSVLQCVAVCCSVLQCVAVCCIAFC